MAGRTGRRGSNAAAALRRRRSIELRASGLSYPSIARELEISVGQAYADVQRAIADADRDTGEVAREYRTLELERLEMPVEALHRSMTREGIEPKEYALLCEVWRKLSESRRRLVGADAPVKTELHGPDGGPLVLNIHEEIVGSPASPAPIVEEVVTANVNGTHEDDPAAPSAG